MAMEDEYRTLREGCGVAEITWRGRLEILGADRLRFLHNYVTCDVKGLAPGSGAYGFFTNPKGGILSDAVILAQEDRLWVEIGQGQEEAIASHLKKFLVADRVEIRPLERREVLLVGPRAEAVLGDDLSSLPSWGHRGGFQRRGLIGGPAWVTWTVEPEIDRFIAKGAQPVSFEALEILRAEAGIPRFGQDFGPENFPQETGIEEAVSYTKGCYLGQEIVARIHYRGGVQNLLRGLVFEGDGPQPGASLLYDGREAGRATTVVRSPALERTIGLAILHRRVEPGARVEVEGGGTAEVREISSPPWGRG